MTTTKRLFDPTQLAQVSRVPIPVIYKKMIEWEGVRIGHFRLLPGEMPERVHRSNHVFVPLAGSITIEGKTDSGAPLPRRRRTVGDISVTPVGTRYSAYWETELDEVTISLTEDFINRATVDFTASRNARLVLACGPQDALVRSIAQHLANELDADLPAGRLYVESLVNALAVHLLRYYSTDSLIPDLQFGGLPAHKLRRVTDFIEANLERDLTLTEIAEAIDLSQYHFARAFKQTTGHTPIQYLMQRRVEAAKQLLVESDLPIAEIALRTGFKNQSHFTTLFRKSTALTPRGYRNQQY
jgi:AraC family transcriptional regulator